MVWWIVVLLAALYLLLRFVQMTHFFVTQFLLASVIPLPVKVVVLLGIGGMVLGARLWWKRHTRGQQASKRQA